MAACMSLTTAKGQWSDYTSYEKCTMVAAAGATPVAGNTVGLFSYSESDGYMEKIVKTNGKLSDVGITAIGAIGSRLYVGYGDGDIDVLEIDSETPTEIPELKNSSAYQLKTINCFEDAGWKNRVYCGFACGILELDATKLELRSVWRVVGDAGGTNVTSVAVAGGKIYAATSDGVYVADQSSAVLENSKQWTLIAGTEGALSVASVGDRAYAAAGTLGGEATLYGLPEERGESEEIDSLTTVEKYRYMRATKDGKIAVLTDSSIKTYTTAGELAGETGLLRTSEGQTVGGSYRQMSMMSDGRVAVADYYVGMIVCNADGRGAYTRKPSGPIDNTHSSIVGSGDAIYLTGEARDGGFNNAGKWARVKTLHDGEWSYTETTTAKDACMLAADPNGDGRVYAATWGYGIFEIKDYGFSTNYTSGNSTLTDIFGGYGYVRTDAMAFDTQHNLYVVTPNNTRGVHVMTSEGDWYYTDYGPVNGSHSNLGMTVTKNDNIWIWPTRKGAYGLEIANMQGTFSDEGDDTYWSTESSKESQSLGSFSLTDASSGEEISDRATCVAADRDGDVWIGTDGGILVCTNDARLMDGEAPELNRIRVPRNDGTDLADYLLDEMSINAIVVDGGNRKWIATSTDGIYLVSGNGYETIHHFTKENSPLFNDNVERIAIRPRDGELFIVTAEGLQSFAADAVEPSSELKEVRVYPNPVSMSRSEGYVTITGLEYGSHVFVTDVAGNRMFYSKSNGGMVRWNLKRMDGGRAASGVYIIWASSTDGSNTAVGKILLRE